MFAGAAGALIVLQAHKTGYEKGIDAAIIAMEPYDPDDNVEASMQRHPAGKQRGLHRQPLHLIPGEDGDHSA